MKRLIVCLTVGVSVACATHGGRGPVPPAVAQPPEQAAAALRERQAQAASFLAAQEASFREQPRDEAWATPQEQRLRQSFAQEVPVPQGALKAVECRSSRCLLQLVLPPESARAPQALPAAAAVEQWIAWSQPCGYTLTQEPATQQAPGTVRIFLDCERN